MSLKEDRQMENEIADAIHYPRCWDTACYPTLVIALWEGYDSRGIKCPTCHKIQKMKVYEARK